MKTYSSKEEFEKKNPYVLVTFEVINGSTYATITKSFSNKRTADLYYENYGHRNQEVMTRKKYNREASNCL